MHALMTTGIWSRRVAATLRSITAVAGLGCTLGLLAGCPPTTPPGPQTCATNEDCQDSRFCNGAEVCGTNGTCEEGEPPCPAEFCVENADFCPECTEDADCDDGLFCNGVEACTPPEAGEVGLTCADGTSPCAAGQECNEAAARCETVDETQLGTSNPDVDFGALVAGEPVTLTAPAVGGKRAIIEQASCACAWDTDGSGTFSPATACTTLYTPGLTDGEVSVTETCGDEVFVFTAAVTVSEVPPCETDDECDDGVFCNGAEICTGGECAAGSNPCTTSGCDEDNDVCADECATDADCDDDLFCTGDETCGANGFCVAGESPCDEGETCQEGDTAAVCIPPAVQSVLFTLAQDNLLGTANSDSFSAPLAVSGTGTQVPTLQNGDMANGLAGADALSATYNNNNTGVAATLAPTLSGIESLILSDLGGNATTAFSGVNVTGATSLTSSGSLVDLTANNLAALTGLGVTNSDFDLAVTFISPAYNGTTDAVSLTLNGARDSNPATAQGCTVNITTPANGIETLNVVSSGGTENVLEALTQTTGTTLTTLAASGSTAFTVRRGSPLPGTLTTINCGTATAATDLTVGGAVNVTYTGGSGNDTINYAGTYASTDTINGGTGVNTLGINSAQAVAVVAAQSNISNIANILIPDSLNGNINVTLFGAAPASAATDAILDTTAAATNLTGGASQITLGAGNRTLTLNNDDTAHNLTAVVTGAGTTDVLTVNLQNADLAATFAANGAETVTFNSANGSDGTAADGGANTAVNVSLTPTTGTGTLSITGAIPVTITGVITAGTINASAATGAFTMETTSSSVNTASATVTGSGLNDELTGGAGADNFTGGEGNDTIKGLGGADVCAGGNGTDRFFFDAVGDFGDTINDFTGGTDKVGLASGIINFAGVAGTEVAPVALTAADFETTRAAIPNIVAGDALKIVRLSMDQTTMLLTNDVGAAVAAYVLAFDTTLSRGVLYHDADWSSTGGRTLVARFENIQASGTLAALTFTDFEEID